MNRPSHYRTPFKETLKQKILAWPEQIFTRKDLSLTRSNQEQLRLNRALKTFTAQGFIIKISHGLYAKAKLMTFPNGITQPVLQESFETVAIEAMNKFAVIWEFSQAIQDYNAGKTTQIPAIFSIRLKSRFRRTIHAEGRSLLFEDGINAR